MRTIKIEQDFVDEVLDTYQLKIDTGDEGATDIIVHLDKTELTKLREEIEKHLNRT